MSGRKHMKRPSDEQKTYLLEYMEKNREFALDRSESSERADERLEKWKMIATKLNGIVGPRKDVNRWRKYWRDQKLHVREREALIKSSHQRSIVNGMKKLKQLNSFELRVIALIGPDSETRPALCKRKKVQSEKQPEDHTPECTFEEKKLKIEEEKLSYIKKSYELQQKALNWKMEYEGKLLELREREIFLREKEFELCIKNEQ